MLNLHLSKLHALKWTRRLKKDKSRDMYFSNTIEADGGPSKFSHIEQNR